MAIEQPHIILPAMTNQEFATVLAALTYYHRQGMGDPQNRPDWLHTIATDRDNTTSLDSNGINDLNRRIATGSEDMDIYPVEDVCVASNNDMMLVTDLVKLIRWWNNQRINENDGGNG